MLSLKKPSFAAFVAWLLILLPFTSVVCIRPALAMKKGRRTDHWEDEWDNERLLLLTVENISVPPCLVSFFLSSCSCSCSCSSCSSCCCSCKPQKPKRTKSIEKPGNQPTAKSQEAKKPRSQKPRSHGSHRSQSHRSQKPKAKKPQKPKAKSQEAKKPKAKKPGIQENKKEKTKIKYPSNLLTSCIT